MSALSKGDGTVTENNFKDELKAEFGETKVTDNTITKSADGKTWTVEIDGVTQDVEAGTVAPVVTSSLTPEELAALATQNTKDSNDQIAEIIGDEITNNNLKENPRIKAVLTGEVPLTKEMTYVTGTKDTGVVVSIDNSEFVWVPVPVAIWDGTTTITSGTYTPMAKSQSGSTTDYEGLLYTFSGTTSTYQSGYTVTDTSTFREPAIIVDYDGGSSDTARITLDGENGLQAQYNAMIASVAKYGGFYVGRYELGLEGDSKLPVSKKASSTVTTADATSDKGNMWYGLYSKCKSYSADNLTSSMIWGSQYDAMMNWMAKTGKTVGTADDSKYNQAQTTGSKEEDIINNVKDLYGCHYEWTIEAYGTYNRANRGAVYGVSIPASNRSYFNPDSTDGNYSSRLSLYIK